MHIRSLHLFISFCLACIMAGGPPSAMAAGGRKAGENWESARRLVASDPEWKRWLEAETATVSEWMTAARDAEDQEAGWIHDFQEEGSGAFKAWTPATDCNAAGARGSRERTACVALRRHRHIQMTLAAARLANLTGERKYADWAAAQLDMYARMVGNRSAVKRNGAVLFRQGLDEANLVPALADSVRLLRPFAGSAKADTWCAGLLQPLAGGLLGAQKQVHNIAVWYSSAAAIAGMECGDGALLGQAQQGQWSLPALLEQGASPDGFWFELSLGYQNYVVRALNEVMLAAAVRGMSAQFPSLPEFSRALLAGPMKVRFGADAPTINDSNRYLHIPDAALLKSLRRILPTAAGVQQARANRDWDLLLDPPRAADTLIELEGASAAGGAEIPGLKSLFLRSRDWQALLRAGQKAPFHAHQDTLTLELKYGDTWLFRNSVTPAYGSELHKKFYKLALAHNTPLVDGLGVSNWFGQPARTEASANSIAAEFKSFQRGTLVRRTLTVDGPNIEDRLDFTGSGARPGSVGAIYHTDCTVERENAQSTSIKLPDTPGFGYLSPNARWQESAGDWPALLKCGARRFRLVVRASAPLTVTLAAAPALAPPRKRTALLVTVDGGADNTTLRFRLEPALTTATKEKS